MNWENFSSNFRYNCLLYFVERHRKLSVVVPLNKQVRILLFVVCKLLLTRALTSDHYKVLRLLHER